MTEAVYKNKDHGPGTFVKTRSQTIAATPDASVWVSASAGSGKTKVLADRVLRLLLQGSPADKVLCLTFTRAAAAEMQNRIRNLLGEWAVMAETELDVAITGLTGEAPTPASRRIAQRLFAEVLDTPGGLKIQTIHAFCESLLGRFPIEAGIAPYFEVMDERTAAEYLLIARDEILDAARRGTDEALANALSVVTYWVHEDEFADLMAAISSKRGRLHRLISSHDGPKGAVRATKALLEVAAEETVDALLQSAAIDTAIDDIRLRGAATALSVGGKQDKEKANIITTWLAGDTEQRIADFEAYSMAYLTAGGTIRANLASKGAVKTMSDIVDVLEQEAKRILEVRERCKAILTVEATEAILLIGTALISRYEEQKRRCALLDYDDLILRARSLVERAAPWVLFKLDGGIDHILIDEAQDSNADQWAVVRAIADEFHAGIGASEIERSIFAVGDEKQSIFSFQGAAPDQFAAMSDYFEKRVTDAGKKWHRVPLDVSFRSTSAILQAVDAVFADPITRDGVSITDIRHKAHRRGQAGVVEMWPPVVPGDSVKPAAWEIFDPNERTLTPAFRLAHSIAWRISRWISEGERLPSADRPLRPGDIMVLVRRRTDFVDKLIGQLKNRGVNVAGLDRMVLTDQLAVQDLVALGAFALMPQDDLNLAAVLKGPLIGLNESKLFEICHQRNGTVWASLRRLARTDSECAAAQRKLSDVLSRADLSPPYEFFAHILGPMEGRALLLARLRKEANDPIDEFLALALAFEQTHTPSLQGFLRWLEEGDAEIKRDLEQGQRDEVRIMTVHGAKGLQAPVVILADTMQVPLPDNGLMWNTESDAEGQAADVLLWAPRSRVRERKAKNLASEQRRRQDQEYRRLLYVAMTRAEDRLYIAGYGARRAAPENAWWNIISRGLEPIAEPFAFNSHPDGPYNDVDIAWHGRGLRLETPQSVDPDRRGADNVSPGTVPGLPSWADTPAPEEPKPSRPLAPSRPALPEPAPRSPMGDDRGLAFQRGLLVHRLLQTLPDVAEADRADAARAYLARPLHDLTPDRIDELIAETLAVIDDPYCADLFGPGSRAEVSVTGVVGGITISGRIDRIVIGPKKVKILDFKTNRPPPRKPSEVPNLYLAQMAAYRALLRKIYTIHQVECVLVWTLGPFLMPLDAQLLDIHEP